MVSQVLSRKSSKGQSGWGLGAGGWGSPVLTGNSEGRAHRSPQTGREGTPPEPQCPALQGRADAEGSLFAPQVQVWPATLNFMGFICILHRNQGVVFAHLVRNTLLMLKMNIPVISTNLKYVFSKWHLQGCTGDRK